MKPSISVFFPCYNDAGTIAAMVIRALQTLRDITDDYEVIVVNDASPDDSHPERTRVHLAAGVSCRRA
jgi:glycosyltransferase involved in cell wall biosynthesis